MGTKGKFLCPSPSCSVFAGGRGRAQRRSWTSSWGCLAFTSSTTPRTRHPLRTTPSPTPVRPPVRIRTRIHLRRTMEAPLPGRHGVDLHLGQKPKLGGRYTDITLIYISYHVGTLYIHVSIFFLSFSFFLFIVVYSCLPKTQKDQKYFCCFSLFIYLVFSISLLSF